MAAPRITSRVFDVDAGWWIRFGGRAESDSPYRLRTTPHRDWGIRTSSDRRREDCLDGSSSMHRRCSKMRRRNDRKRNPTRREPG